MPTIQNNRVYILSFLPIVGIILYLCAIDEILTFAWILKVVRFLISR